MNIEQLRIQFNKAAEKAVIALDIVEAIKTLPADGSNQIADYIAEFCQDRRIDPQAPELVDFYKQTTEYKTALETQEKQKNIDQVFSEWETIKTEYQENKSRGAIPSQEQINSLTNRLNKSAAKLGSVYGKKRIYTATDYLVECLNYDPSKDFTPALFGGLAFPDGTTSYIGARTGRGKTTAMVNLARETVTAKQPRKTIFITLEMSGKQILNKLILSTAFHMGITVDNPEDPAIRRALLSINPGKYIYTVWKQGDLPGSGAREFREYVTTAWAKIETAQKTGIFILFDGRGASLAEIINFITAQVEKGTVVLLDYIQKMPPKAGTDTDSFRKVQAISYEVVNTAAKTNAVIIAGAQFNRMGGTDKLGDMFDDQSFREAGDIEQDAHNAIGIGWKTDRHGRFYEVLKTREDKKQGSIYALDFAGEYSYMNSAAQIFRPQGKNSGAENGKSKKKPKPDTWKGTQEQWEEHLESRGGWT